MAHEFFTCRKCKQFWGYGSYVGKCPKVKCPTCGSNKVWREGAWIEWMGMASGLIMLGALLYEALR